MPTARRRHREAFKKSLKQCNTCGQETRWLSVDGNCWDCTVKAIKNKKPLPPPPEEETEGGTEQPED